MNNRNSTKERNATSVTVTMTAEQAEEWKQEMKEKEIYKQQIVDIMNRERLKQKFKDPWEKVEHSSEWVPSLQRVEVSAEEVERVSRGGTTFTEIIIGKLGGRPNFSDYAEMQMTNDRFVVYKVIGDDKAIYFIP